MWLKRGGSIVVWAVVSVLVVGCSSSTSGKNVGTGTGGSHAFYLRPVICRIAAFDTSAPPQTAPVGDYGGLCADAGANGVPSTSSASESPSQDVILPSYGGTSRYVLGPADMSGADVSTAGVISDATGQYEVQLQFTGKGSTEMNKIAAQRFPFYEQNRSNPPYQSQEATELDGRVLSAPAISAPTFDGMAFISGPASAPFTKSQAQAIVRDIMLAR